MPLFSQRKGLKPVKSVVQLDSMDADLRTGLWNVLSSFYFDRVIREWLHNLPSIRGLLREMWHSYFKEPVDTLDDWGTNDYDKIRKYFFHCEWNEAYDFIEFVVNTFGEEHVNREFTDACNGVLKRELSGYRLVGGRITQITSKDEIAEIEVALEVSEPLKPVNEHLKSSLALLADKKSPDYRNSIKESISAVEAVCRLISAEKNATLGTALDLIEKQGKVSVHPALKGAFDKLYGYTSVADGIRHALLEESSLEFEDAKFMLVSCSAFVNYLIAKASTAGIKL